MSKVLEDLERSKGVILGIISFATAVVGFLVGILHWNPEYTMLGVICASIVLLYLGYLMTRIETRQTIALQQHIDNSNKIVEEINDTLQRMEKLAQETRKDTLRIQIRDYIRRTPEDVENILAIAEIYFLEMEGNWVTTNEFLYWAEENNVKLSSALTRAVELHNGKK